MARHKDNNFEKRNIPLPIILINSSSTAEKYDNYLKSLSKEYPTTIKNFANEKKIIQDKKKKLLLTMEQINNDVNEMKAAVLQIETLHDRERKFQNEKDNQISQLESIILKAEERKQIINKNIAKYTSLRDEFSTMALQNKFKDVRSLVRHYLLLQHSNEFYIKNKSQPANNIEDKSIDSTVLQKISRDHQFDIMKCEKKFKEVMKEQEAVKTKLHIMRCQLEDTDNIQVKEHENWELLKRWINEMHTKINAYKETPCFCKDAINQLNELQDFIIAGRKIIKK